MRSELGPANQSRNSCPCFSSPIAQFADQHNVFDVTAPGPASIGILPRDSPFGRDTQSLNFILHGCSPFM